MSGVDALRAAIEATDAVVKAGPPRVAFPKASPAKEAKPAASPKKPGASPRIGYKPPVQLSPEAKAVVDTVSSFYPPAAIAAKFLTGGTVDDWTAFVGTTLAALKGKTDTDVTPEAFGAMVTKFVALRASLVKSGYKLPDVTIPVLSPPSGGFPAWVYVIAGIAAVAGVVFGIRALG